MNFSIRGVNQKDYKEIIELFTEVDVLRPKNLPHVFPTADEPARVKEGVKLN